MLVNFGKLNKETDLQLGDIFRYNGETVCYMIISDSGRDDKYCLLNLKDSCTSTYTSNSIQDLVGHYSSDLPSEEDVVRRDDIEINRRIR